MDNLLASLRRFICYHGASVSLEGTFYPYIIGSAPILQICTQTVPVISILIFLCIPIFIAAAACFLSFYSSICDFIQFIIQTEGPNGTVSLHFGYWSNHSWKMSNSTNETIIEETCELPPVDATAPDTYFKVGWTFIC
jgi:hypothetical protein